MNRYGLTDRGLHQLAERCGRRVCTTGEHHDCPYGDEGLTDCVDRLEKDHEDMVLRLLERDDIAVGGPVDGDAMRYVGAIMQAEEDDSCERCDNEECAARGEGYTMPCPAVTSMDADTEIDILSRAVETYGAQAQMDMMLEEMSELAKALLKYRRAGRQPKKYASQFKQLEQDVLEEMADTQIMLNQMCLIFGDFNEQEIEKLERLDARLREAGA